MISNDDTECSKKHFQELERLVQDSFPGDEIKSDEPSREVHIRRNGIPQPVSVVIKASDEMLSDRDNVKGAFRQKVSIGIDYAKKIIKNPQNPNFVNQGVVHIGHNGVHFVPRDVR